jgi:hypothetical protein
VFESLAPGRYRIGGREIEVVAGKTTEAEVKP